MEYSLKDFSNKILTGMSIGIVVALVPGALLGEIAKALNWTMVVQITGIAASLLSVVMGLCIALQFKLSPIHAGTLTLTTAIGSGVFKFKEGMLIMAGIGDVVNAGIVATLAVLTLLYIGNKLKAYTILIVPMSVIVIIGGLGLFMLPYVAALTGAIGVLINSFTTFTPIIAGILISVTFAILIVSPISTVGVAVAISLAGVSSGAANLGVCAAGFGLAIAGYKYNGFGTSIAHFLGSPKMQMANVVKAPKIMLPILLNAAVCGAVAGILSIQGTSFSAGFGISGLIGPINHLNLVANGYTFGPMAIAVFAFVIVPIIMAFISTYIFEKIFKIIDAKDYYIEFN